tara:strand:- start:1582 stop:2601 length:1020 start_codon:yes stop_codon:yes gene_type:complete
MSSERWGALRRIFSERRPGPKVWDDVCKLFLDWPEDTEREMAIQYAASHFADWKDTARMLPCPSIPHVLALEVMCAPHYRGVASLVRGISFSVLWNASENTAETFVGKGQEALNIRGLERLLASEHISFLKRLQFRKSWAGYGTGVNASGAMLIAESPHVSQLNYLEISDGSIGAEGANWLAQSSSLCSLQKLLLPSCYILDEGLIALAKAAHLSGLKLLECGGNNLHDEGLIVLAQSPHMMQLKTLSLYGNKITTVGLTALLSTNALPSLRRLNLEHNQLEDKAIDVLLSSSLTRQLTHLQLGGNRFTEKGLRRLAEAEELHHIKKLVLGNHFSLHRK